MSLLITTIVLSVGISMANIAVKEFTLSVTGRESLLALYAADAGAECAAFWDIRGDKFPVNNNPTFTPPAQLFCNGDDVVRNPDPITGQNEWTITTTPTSAQTTFMFHFNAKTAADPCVKVSVQKTWTDNLPPAQGGVPGQVDPGEVATRLVADGFSACGQGIARRVQRTLEQNY